MTGDTLIVTPGEGGCDWHLGGGGQGCCCTDGCHDKEPWAPNVRGVRWRGTQALGVLVWVTAVSPVSRTALGTFEKSHHRAGPEGSVVSRAPVQAAWVQSQLGTVSAVTVCWMLTDGHGQD